MTYFYKITITFFPRAFQVRELVKREGFFCQSTL